MCLNQIVNVNKSINDEKSGEYEVYEPKISEISNMKQHENQTSQVNELQSNRMLVNRTKEKEIK